jgi:DNA-binding transcriptional MerR regulator
MAPQLAPSRVLELPVIPDRLYFKIGDVARICSVETYVLRFWETQFPQLKPNKSGTGQRLYRRRDVEIALKIKQLVHDQGYTIVGARQMLEPSRRHTAEPQRDVQPSLPLPEALSDFSADDITTALAQARTELREIVGLLSASQPLPPRRRARVTAMPSKTGTLFPNT